MDLLESSVEVLLKNQSRYGSFIAAPNFKPYGFCWLRDSSYIAYALDLMDRRESVRFFDWAFRAIEHYGLKVDSLVRKKAHGEKILAEDHLHARYTLRGFEDYGKWGNKQFDGCGNLLWAFSKHLERTGEESQLDTYLHEIAIIVRYLTNFWDDVCYDVWEENGDKVHLSTISAIYGGLSHINEYLKEEEITKSLKKIKKYVTDNFVSDNKYMKMYDPSKNKCSGLDSTALTLFFPNKVVEADDSTLANTVKEIEKRLFTGGGLKRYDGDTYYGGNPWIVTTGMLALYYTENGKLENARDLVGWIEDHSRNSLLPEQVFDSKYANDPLRYQWWLRYWGQPANPLLWSHAMYIIAKKNLTD
jgi:GH15 family glucan-1,4-alpha-glucosidase